MPWYIVSLMTHHASSDVPAVMVRSREYYCVVPADDREAAYGKSLNLGKEITDELVTEGDGQWVLDGISALLQLDGQPAAGSEILWEQAEIRPDEIGGYVRTKDFLSAFSNSADPIKASGWYLCEPVLVEVHDTGTHGEKILVWVNSHLIEASDEESAYSLAVALGNQEALESGGHRCDGDSAHWEFRGLRNLSRTMDAPGDCAMLWFDERNLSLAELDAAVPSPAKFRVFDSENPGQTDKQEE